MMKNRVATLASVIMAGTMALASPAAGQSLTDALISAYRNSNLLEQNRAVLRAADEDVAVSVSRLRPVVNFIASADQRFVDTTATNFRPVDVSASLRIAAELTVHDFGRTDRAIDAAKETVLATREALVGVEQQVLLAAVRAYMDVRSAAETVTLRENNLELIRQELQAARDRFEVGEVTRTDVSIAESRLAAARSNLAAAEGDLEVAREAYKAATGGYPVALGEPPALPQTASSLEAAQSVARRRHPSIKQAQHEVAAADYNVARAAAAVEGQVTAGANVGVTFQTQSTQSLPQGGMQGDLGLSLSYQRPMYRGGELSALQRQAMARRDGARAALHQSAVQVLQDVGRAWSDLQVSRARIEASERQIEAARRAYEGVREEATLGARTTLDVLDAEQELLDARATRIQALASQQVAAYALLSSMGLLTVEHLNLGIPTYDPATYYNAVSDAPRSIQGERLERVLQSIGRE